MTNEPDIVRILRNEDKLGKLRSNTSLTNEELEFRESIDNQNQTDSDFNIENEYFEVGNFDKIQSETNYKLFSDLIDIINFTEKVSTSILGDFTKEEIVSIVIDEFKKSNKYTGSILLLTDDEKNLYIAGTSSENKSLRRAEKISGFKIKNYNISLEKSNIYRKVIYEGKTVHFKILDLLEEMLPKKLAFIISKTIKIDKNIHVATPLKLDGKIIGAFAMSSTMLHNFFISSVKNLSIHISHSFENAKHIIEQKNTEAILSKSEEMFRTMIEKAPLGIFTVDTGGLVTSCNETFIKLAGYPKDELVGKNIINFPTLRKIDIPNYLKIFKSIINGDVPKSFKFNWINKAGTLCTGELFISLIKIENKITGVQAIIKDNTETQDAKIKLKDAEERYNSLFNGSMDLVYICDFKGHFIDANNAALNLLGYKHEDIKSLNFSKLLDIGQGLKAYKVIKETKKFGYQKSIQEFKLKRNNGEYIYVESMGSLIFHNGKPYAIQGIARDITDRKLAEKSLRESEEKYRNIVELAPDGILTVNRRGIVNSCNPAFLKLTGFSKEEILDKHVSKLPTMRKKEIPKYLKLFGSLMRGNKQQSFEFEWIHKNGTHHLAEARASLLKKDNKIVGMQAILRDITEQKIAEKELHDAHEKLKNLNIELEKKVEERTNEIKKLLKQKDEFINQLGHDLKNPLTPLVNLIPLIEKTETDPKAKETLQVLHRNVDYMKNLVIKTIELARLNSSETKFNFEDTNLLTEINNIVEANKLMFDENKIKIINNIPNDIFISVDKLRIEELFNNIFNNSVKYTEDSGIIKIDAKSDKNFIIVSISDTGIGMSKDQLSQVFNEFYKADCSRHDFDSSGLGLPICKRIVEKHGGSIWIESPDKTKGTTVYFTLPKSKKIHKWLKYSV